MFGKYDDGPLLKRVIALAENSSQQVKMMGEVMKGMHILHAQLDLIRKRIDRLEQKSSISYLKPLDPRDGGF